MPGTCRNTGASGRPEPDLSAIEATAPAPSPGSGTPLLSSNPDAVLASHHADGPEMLAGVADPEEPPPEDPASERDSACAPPPSPSPTPGPINRTLILRSDQVMVKAPGHTKVSTTLLPLSKAMAHK